MVLYCSLWVENLEHVAANVPLIDTPVVTTTLWVLARCATL